jgi:hypothetical protein
MAASASASDPAPDPERASSSSNGQSGYATPKDTEPAGSDPAEIALASSKCIGKRQTSTVSGLP